MRLERPKPSTVVAIAVGCAAAVAAVLLLRASNAADERELTEFADEIELGQSRQEVESAFHAESRPGLSLGASGTNELVVATPSQFGADNWYLYVTFDASNEASSIRFRTEDSARTHPRGSPSDRAIPGVHHPATTLP